MVKKIKLTQGKHATVDDDVYEWTKQWKWCAIQVDGKNIHLGSFADKQEAARAYDKAAREYHGEFANTNF